ncbi:hypothetical protein HA466_0078200 [Hirschfeldia incana]|nr:hypothetical protein HA466_0078200 [Hirschfeldia incana]
MADVENQPDSSFPVKRKPDLCCQEQDNVANKAQKLNPSSSAADSESGDGAVNGSGVENLNSGKNETESSNSLEKAAGSLPEKDQNVVPGDLASEEGGVGEEDEDEEEEEDEEDDEEDEEDSTEAEIDRKGKGISREDKGKGKLIEIDSSDDSDDEDEDGGEYDESELSDDPLAEVDLDNILPSRTRRRSIQPGVYISGGNNNEDVDESSDDSDA